jgi:hypothetical protein
MGPHLHHTPLQQGRDRILWGPAQHHTPLVCLAVGQAVSQPCELSLRPSSRQYVMQLPTGGPLAPPTTRTNTVKRTCWRWVAFDVECCLLQLQAPVPLLYHLNTWWQGTCYTCACACNSSPPYCMCVCLQMLSAKERCLEFLADNLAAAELAAYAAEQRAEAAEAELSLLRQQLAGAATSTASSSLGTRSPDVSEGGSADLTVTVRLLGPAGSMCAAAAAGAPAKLSSGKLSCGGGGELRRGAPVALVLPGGPLSQAWCACPADTWVDPVAGDRQDFFTSSLRARTQRLTRLTCDSVAGCHMDSNPLWEA